MKLFSIMATAGTLLAMPYLSAQALTVAAPFATALPDLKGRQDLMA